MWLRKPIISELKGMNANKVYIKSQHYFYQINNVFEQEVNGEIVVVIEEGSQVREE